MTAALLRRRRRSGLGAAVAGMLLIAATYGMARFGVGLFAPLLTATRPSLAGVVGLAAAAQFVSYSAAALAAARLVDRNPRAGVLLAGITATVGCLGVATATEPPVFVVAVLVGGLGGGFASPALVPIVDAVVDRRVAATGQSLVNAGTAVGVIGAGLVSFVVTSIGFAWTVMAVICALATVAAWYPVRSRADLGAGTGASRSTPVGPAGHRVAGAGSRLLVPAGAAVVVGVGSALVWTFGPLLVVGAAAVTADGAGWLWIALGLGGFVGTLTGVMVERIGVRAGWCVTAVALALASAGIGLAVTTGSAWVAYGAMAVFGAGYMSLSGVLILWARRAWPDRSGAGVSVLFVALAVGQAIGSAGFGATRTVVAPVVLTIVAAVLCLAGGAAGLLGASTRLDTASTPPRRRAGLRTASAVCESSGDRDPIPGGETHARSISSGCSLAVHDPRLTSPPGAPHQALREGRLP